MFYDTPFKKHGGRDDVSLLLLFLFMWIAVYFGFYRGPCSLAHGRLYDNGLSLSGGVGTWHGYCRSAAAFGSVCGKEENGLHLMFSNCFVCANWGHIHTFPV